MPAKAPDTNEQQIPKHPDYKLIGKNYTTPDLYAKVTGRAKYAEDYRAECGACTVLVGNTPHYSCSVLTHTVRDQKVLTIEGLANPDGTLHPVQQAVVDEQGFQCAFCMSGFIMSAVGFLKENPNPTRAELAHGVSGNLCRCQDYDKILTALMRGAEYSRKA